MGSRILLVIFALAIFSGCKKGENDPLFSLKPRKARLSGVWIAESAEWTTGNTTLMFDGTNLERSDTIKTDKFGYSLTIRFDAGGGYTYSTVVTYLDDYSDTTLTGIVCENTETGLWNFTGGAGGSKTKSQLLLLVSKIEETCSDQPANVSTVSVAGQNEGLVYYIDRLTDKELVLKYSKEVATGLGAASENVEIRLNKEESK